VCFKAFMCHILRQVATLVRADWLFLLTDVPSLFTANPSTDPSAQPIHEVHDIAALQASMQHPNHHFLHLIQQLCRASHAFTPAHKQLHCWG
jgi:hypothetical protein